MQHQENHVDVQVIGDHTAGDPTVDDPAVDERPVDGHLDGDGPTGGRCGSAFDRWRCVLPDGHDGPHRAGDASERTEWNDRASGRGLHDLARPRDLVERAARDAERR